MGSDPRSAPPADAVQSHLAKLAASASFAASARSCELLRFTVLKALAGDKKSLKETVLGVEVFGRKPDFDPQSNSTVRVEFARLRKKLDHYYQHEGHSDPIRITYSKGSYVPEFRWRLDVR